MLKNTKHGGARKGAGRKAKEPTVVMRIPLSLVEKVRKLIKNLYKSGGSGSIG